MFRETTMKGKVLSVLLALTLVFTMMPGLALLQTSEVHAATPGTGDYAGYVKIDSADEFRDIMNGKIKVESAFTIGAEEVCRLFPAKGSNKKLIYGYAGYDEMEEVQLFSYAKENRNKLGTIGTGTVSLEDISDEFEYGYPDFWYKPAPVCQIDETKYTSLEEAITAAGTTQSTIKMLSDVIVDNTVVIPASANIILDLNGKKIYGELPDFGTIIQVEGELKVVGSDSKSGISELDKKYYVIKLTADTAKVTVDTNGTLKGFNGICGTKGTVVVDYAIISSKYSYAVCATGDSKINDGIFTGKSTVADISMPNGSVKGGYYTHGKAWDGANGIMMTTDNVIAEGYELVKNTDPITKYAYEYFVQEAGPKADLSDISATAITYGQTLADSTVTGTATFEGKDVTGTWSFKEGTTVPKVSDSDTTEYTVVFTPDESTKLDPTEGKAKLTVNKATLKVSGITAAKKTYDGKTDATLSFTSAKYDGKVGTDDVTVSATGAFADNAVAKDKTVNITYADTPLSGKDAGNYTFDPKNSQQTATADIAAKAVKVTGLAAESKTYDGTTDAGIKVSGTKIEGVLDGEELSVASATGTFNNKNVGASKTVTISDITLGGADKDNYAVDAENSQKTAEADIAAKAVKLTGVAARNKVYDGNTVAELDFGSADFGKIDGDALTVSAIGTFADKNVAAGKTVTLSEIALSGADKNNYELILEDSQKTATADITTKPVKVTGIKATSKTYDGNENATLDYSTVKFGGIVSGETLTVSATGTFKGKNVEGKKTVAISDLTLGGKDAANYSVSADSQTTAVANITAKTVKVTGIAAEDKTYDGNENATLDYSAVSFDGIIDGDALTASAKGAFADKNVGADKTVTISDITLDGADAANYSVSSESQTTAKAKITAKDVKVTGITAEDKTYDGNENATLDYSAVSFDEMISGDDLTASAKGTFADKKVGADKDVTISDITLGGADAANYNVASDSQTTATATITAKVVKVTGITVADKTYDGTKDATLDYSAVSFDGMVSGDDLTASATGAFKGKNAGADKAVTISDITLGGADAANYSVSTKSQKTATADITAKTVTFSGITAKNKTYDGNTDVELYFRKTVFDGKVDGDKLTVTAKGAFKDAAAGTNKTVTITDPQLGGTSAANYKLAAKGNQTKATATIYASKSVTKAPTVGKHSIKISWGATAGAAKYIVYGNKCGKKNKFKKLATVKTPSFTLKKLNGKKLTNHTFYKLKVEAVDAKGNVLSKTRQMHITTGMYKGKVGDTVSVTLNAKSKTLEKGKTFQLKAKVKNYKGLKSVSHVAKVRYFSSSNAVAKVDSKGKITAKKAGTCTIYAMGATGVTAQIAVTVQ